MHGVVLAVPIAQPQEIRTLVRPGLKFLDVLVSVTPRIKNRLALRENCPNLSCSCPFAQSQYSSEHELLSAACRAISSYLKSGDNYVVVTVPPQLFLQRLEKLALELGDFATAQARHVNVVARESSLVVVPLALNMHQIELVNKAVTFQKSQGSIYGAPID
jgi:hypothetical protein